jgi:hypothetical protein
MRQEQRRPPAGKQTPCPICGSILAAEAILCVDCGYHLGHGRVLKTRDAAAEARDQPPDPTRLWLHAALGTAALGVIVVGAVIWLASRPPAIIGKWTGHAAFDFHGLPVISDDLSLTFRSNGTVLCSDGSSGPYSIKGNVIRMRLGKKDRGDIGIAFDSKFKIERNWLTIERYPLSPKPMSFRKEENATIDAPIGGFLQDPRGGFPIGKRL